MSESRVYAEIHLSAVRHNFELMRKRLPEGTAMCAVVKADAYGHGAAAVSHLMENEPYIWGFAAATADEARALRKDGITKPILILGYVFEEDYEDLIRLGIRTACFTKEMAQRLSEKSVNLDLPAYIHIAVDTGMARIGVPGAEKEEAFKTIQDILAFPGIEAEGIFTHFARADEKDKTNAGCSFARFCELLEYLEKRNIRFPIRHCANSAAIMEMPEAALDMVRPGITIYGIYPSDEMDRSGEQLMPVMELKSHISYIKEVPAQTAVSYGGTYVTSRPSRIATIPVGYADGYPRSLSSRGFVLIGGKRAPVTGRVCMDQFMVDVTDIPCGIHDEVTLMGRDGDEYLSVDELGALSGRFPYEFVCDISRRVPRRIVD